MKTSVGWLLVAIVASCAGTTTSFSPYSSTSVKEPVTTAARRVYPGDLAKVRDAGAEYVGVVNASGGAFESVDEVRDTALEAAASYGGTHVFVGGEDATTRWAKITPDQATTTFSGGSSTTTFGNQATATFSGGSSTTFHPGLAVPITFIHGTYYIVRVPPENWALLPLVLQPHPNAHANRFIKRDAAGYPIPPTSKDTTTTNVAPKGPSDRQWHCQTGGERPRCFQARSTCEYVNPAITCEPSDRAYCFSGRGRNDWCYPTENDCIVGREEMGGSGGCR